MTLGYRPIEFDKYSPTPAQEALQAISRLYERAGGARKAFTTSGLRKAVGGANGLVTGSFGLETLDTMVTHFKEKGRVQRRICSELFEEQQELEPLGVLDFAELLVSVANARYGDGGCEDEEDEDEEDDEEEDESAMENLEALLEAAGAYD